ncbi:MAG: NB-ARC domain-containing protein [Nostoc sp. DedQUE04]|uniref:NB-ARC domain-containing protein n=1 Tax=Nostoc sp. DedQUE04 TaxID=3075390 RepID=UPI002AD22262|nr:NB-ARC domain-containing protein [Nostoc sp. DedQUE04]MDZ8141126.1 NB-ARC domain-containing protein [Nostoc sp. DedQUE04]
MDNPKYESHFYGSVQGVVIGDNQTVTFNFQNGEQRIVPFLAPPQTRYELVGRDELLRDLKQRLFAGGSLALSALKGLPGVGKTALAIELAYDREVLKHFHDGVLWAGLGRQPDVLSHLGAWAMALDIPKGEIAKLTSIEKRAKEIQNAIGTRRMLLVLDDAWQIEAAKEFKFGTPNCAYLVTTRLLEVALEFASERPTQVPELSEEDGLKLLTRLAPSVIEAEPDEAKALVKTVGGLPLALILIGKYLQKETHDRQPRRLQKALVRLRDTENRLRLEEIQGTLERHPSLPVGTPLSLLAAIEISYEALDDVSSLALRSLSVFPPKPNTFSEEAAQAVSTVPDETLYKLTDYGLLESSGPERYMLHQVISDYARMQLGEMEKRDVFQRYLRYFVELAEIMESKLQEEPQRLEGLGQLEKEYENLRAALRWSLERNLNNEEAEMALRLASALEEFWLLHGQAQEGCDWLKKLLEKNNIVSQTLRAKALLRIGNLYRFQDKHNESQEYYQQSGDLYGSLGENEQKAWILFYRGLSEADYGEDLKALKRYEEALELFDNSNNQKGIASVSHNIGRVKLNQGEYDAAREYTDKSLSIYCVYRNFKQLTLKDEEEYAWILHNSVRIYVSAYPQEVNKAKQENNEGFVLFYKLKNEHGIAWSFFNQAILKLNQGKNKAAYLFSKKALALFRRLNNIGGVAWANQVLGRTYLRERRYEKSRECYQEKLKIQQDLNNLIGISYAIEGFARLAVEQGKPTLAIRLFSNVEALREGISYSLPPSDCADCEQSIAKAKAQIDEDTFEAAWTVGREMSIEQAIQEAHGESR